MWVDLKLECTVGATQGRSSASLLREGTVGFLRCQRANVLPRPVSASPSTSDSRVESEHRALREADVQVPRRARLGGLRTKDAPRNRELQAQVACVPEAELEAAPELQREGMRADPHGVHARRE